MALSREEHIPLPAAVIEYALATTEDKTLAPLLERAFTRILSGTPAGRIAIMSQALPLLDDASLFRYPCIVRGDQWRQLMDFCDSKRLAALPLIVGAVMAELGIEGGEPPDGSGGHCIPRP